MEKLTIYNEILGYRVPRKKLNLAFKKFLELENGLGGLDVSLIFIGENKMQELNELWRGGKGPTDVLSFDYGEIYVCTKIAEQNAKMDKIAPKTEILNLFVHGLLHLKGYTHETEIKYIKMMKKMANIVSSI